MPIEEAAGFFKSYPSISRYLDTLVRVGLGYTVGITARENYDYIPLPLALPMVGLEYKKIGIQAVYIPGTYGNGNVLFTWIHWEFP